MLPTFHFLRNPVREQAPTFFADALLILRVVWPLLSFPIVVYGIRSFLFAHHYKQPADATILLWLVIAGMIEGLHIKRLAKKNIIS